MKEYDIKVNQWKVSSNKPPKLLVFKGKKIYDEPSLEILEKIINDDTRRGYCMFIFPYLEEDYCMIEEAIVCSSSPIKKKHLTFVE